MTERLLPRFSTRPHLWLAPNEPLVCPSLAFGKPHQLHTNQFALRDGEDDAFTCQFKFDQWDAQCGAVVYVLSMPGGIRFLAQVEFREVRALRGKNPWEIVRQLGTNNPFDITKAPRRTA